MSSQQARPPAAGRRRTAAWNVVFAYTNVALTLTKYILLVPFYLIYIRLDEFGAWLATGVVLSQILLTDFGLVGSTVQRTSATLGSGDLENLASVIGAGLLVGIGMGGVLMLGAWIAAPYLPLLLDLSPGVSASIVNCFVLVGLANGIATVGAVATGVIKSLQRPITAGLVVLIAEIANIGTTVALLFGGWGLYALPAGLLTRAAIHGLAGTIALSLICSRQLKIRPRPSRSESRVLLGASGNLLVSTIFMKVQSRGDTFFVASVIGPEAAAVYGLTTRAQETLVLAFGQLRAALSPSLAHLHGADNLDRFRTVASRISAILVGLGSVGYATIVARNGDFVSLWVGENLYAGFAVTALFAGAGLVSVAGSVFYDSMIARGEFAVIRRVFTVTGLTHVALIVWLLQMGLFGAPLAALVSTSLWACLFATHYGNQLMLGGSDWLPYLRTLLAGILAAMAAAALGSTMHVSGWAEFTWACVATAVSGLAIFFVLDRRAFRVFREEAATLRSLGRASR